MGLKRAEQRLSRAALGIAALLASALLLALTPIPAIAVKGEISVREVDRAGAGAYWTAVRMRAATPLDAAVPGEGPRAAIGAPGRGRCRRCAW